MYKTQLIGCSQQTVHSLPNPFNEPKTLENSLILSSKYKHNNYLPLLLFLIETKFDSVLLIFNSLAGSFTLRLLFINCPFDLDKFELRWLDALDDVISSHVTPNQ